MVEEFIKFVEDYETYVAEKSKELHIKYFEATISGNPDDYQKVSELEYEFSKYYSDKEKYEFLLKVKESGEIKIFGQSNEKYIKENYVGYLPQNAQSFKKFPIKIIDIVLMGLIKEKGMIGFSKNKIDKAMRALKIVNIENLYNKLIYQVSGGQRQRAMIARAIVGEPKLLILDEPTTGLDVTSQKNFYEILKRLKEEMGMTIVMVTHDIGFVNSYTDRVICINQSIKAKNHNLECLSEPFSTKFYGYSIKMIEHNHSGDAK
jgi:zinc transport system ATP-binding protein